MKQLIEQAKEKGFKELFASIEIADKILVSPSNAKEKISNMMKYLWMCEIQKWLEDYKDLRFPYFCDGIDRHAFAIYAFYESNEALIYESDWHDEKQKSLKQTLIEALKLI